MKDHKLYAIKFSENSLKNGKYLFENHNKLDNHIALYIDIDILCKAASIDISKIDFVEDPEYYRVEGSMPRGVSINEMEDNFKKSHDGYYRALPICVINIDNKNNTKNIKLTGSNDTKIVAYLKKIGAKSIPVQLYLYNPYENKPHLKENLEEFFGDQVYNIQIL